MSAPFPHDGGPTSEALVAQELALRRARQEAAVRDTAGITTTFRVLCAVFLAGALVPAIGFISVLVGLVAGAFGAILLLVKGNTSGALKQILFTVTAAIAGLILWAVVTFVFFAAA